MGIAVDAEGSHTMMRAAWEPVENHLLVLELGGGICLGCLPPPSQPTIYVGIGGGSAWMDVWWMLSLKTRCGVDTILHGRPALHLGSQPWVPPCGFRVVEAVCRPQGKSGLLEKDLVRMGVSLQLPPPPC